MSVGHVGPINLFFDVGMESLNSFDVVNNWPRPKPPLPSYLKSCFGRTTVEILNFHASEHSQHPLEASVVGFINALQVVEGDGMAEQLFVEGKSEAAIDVETVEHSHTQNTTNKVEIRQMLLEC